MNIDTAARMLIGSSPGIFWTELRDELRAGGWSDEEISEAVSRLISQGDVVKNVLARPRIVTRLHPAESGTYADAVKSYAEDGGVVILAETDDDQLIRVMMKEDEYRQLQEIARFVFRARKPTPKPLTFEKSSPYAGGRTLSGKTSKTPSVLECGTLTDPPECRTIDGCTRFYFDFSHR